MLSVVLKVNIVLGVGVEPGGTGNWQKEGSSLETGSRRDGLRSGGS